MSAPSGSRPPSRSPHVLVSAALLVVLLGAVGLLLAVLGSVVLLPQGGVVVVGTLGLLAFLGLQLVVFRGLGLRSRADAQATGGEADEQQTSDWRSWRG